MTDPHRLEPDPPSSAALPRIAAALLAAAALLLSACVYDVPITLAGTRPIDARLVGDWASDDGKEQVKVREWNASTYVIFYNGDLFRAWHSDHAGLPLLTVQDLDRKERKFSYVAATLGPDGTLTVRAIDVGTIPKTLKSSAEARRLLKQHAADPQLFNPDPLVLRRK